MCSFISLSAAGGTTVTGAVLCPENETRMIVSLDTSKASWVPSRDWR